MGNRVLVLALDKYRREISQITPGMTSTAADERLETQGKILGR